MQPVIISLEELKGLMKKKPKYRNVKTVVDGIKFDSKKEADRWKWLKMFEGRTVYALSRQKKYVLEVNGIRVGTYVADFDYWMNGKHIVEDCKGFKTPVYRLKKLLLRACHGVVIKET